MAIAKHRYEAVITREGRIWVVTIPELDIVGQAGKLSEVEEAAKEIIGLWLETEAEDIDVHCRFELPAAEQALIQTAEQSEARARQALAEAAEKRRAAVKGLLSHGLSQTEVATLMGVSKQRVSQLSSSRG